MEDMTLKAIPTKALMEELALRMNMQCPVAVSIKEAARMCGVSYSVISEWVRNDPNFPAIAVGRKTIIPVDGLRKYVAEQGALRIGVRTYSSHVADIVMAKRKRT